MQYLLSYAPYGGGFCEILRFCPICRKTKICYKMAKKTYFFLKFGKFFYIHNFEILALADFIISQFHDFIFIFDFSGFSDFGLKGGKNGRARKFFFAKSCGSKN